MRAEHSFLERGSGAFMRPMALPSEWKRKAPILKEKLDIICKLEETPTKKHVNMASKLGLPVSTLNTAVSKREEIRRKVQVIGASVKQIKNAQHGSMEDILLAWFKEVRAAGVNIDGKFLQEKADDIALSLRIEGFQASNGWLHWFKARHGLVFKTVSGEGKNVDAAVISDWASTLPALISQYRPQDVFNADEAGIYINLEPEKSLGMKSETCQGGKKSKERVTVLFYVNGDGSEKLKLTVIGKFWKPHCFSRNPSLPVMYKANKKAWMTGDFFKLNF